MPRLANISNLRTEDSGLAILEEKLEGFFLPSKDQKRMLYEICGIEYKRYSRSIDCISLQVPSIDQVKTKDDFLLIEMKTTASKKVTELPYGVFFGFTENEETLFKSHDNYRLCFVHTGLKEYCFLTFDEYEQMIQRKRIQYQINFRSKD